MLGPEGVAGLIVARLIDALPAKMVEFRARYNATSVDLPDVDPVMIFGTELDLLAVNQFPAIFVLAQQTDPRKGAPSRRSDGFGDVFALSYQVRVFVWARGQDYADTDRRRNRYTLAVRECLLARPMLTATDATQYAELDKQTWREAYGEVDRDAKARRTIAGGYLEAYWQTQETLVAWQPAVPIPGGVDLTLHMGVGS